jgi:hypothetical protein
MLDERREKTYKLAAAGQIDLAGPRDEAKQLGIYKFDGDDRLTLCLDLGSGKRPDEFAPGKGRVLFVLARAKPGDEKPSAEDVKKAGGDKIR